MLKLQDEHLVMYRFKGEPLPHFDWPEGLSVSRYRGEEDIPAWVECVKPRLKADFQARIYGDHPGSVHPTEDIFFLDRDGRHIGTGTAYEVSNIDPGREFRVGRREIGHTRIHMVGLLPEVWGQGLSKNLMETVLGHAETLAPRIIELTTDEDRPAALKLYLDLGFHPVIFGRLDAEDRWIDVLETCGIDEADAYYADGSYYKKLKRRGLTPKIRFGVMGAGRGKSMMRYCTESGHAELVAVCDKYPRLLEDVKAQYGQEHELALYTDFDEFIKHDMDCVVLANYANEHAPFAIRALKAGKNVISEVLPVQTMKEAVELIEAIEESGKKYYYAEDFCYFPAVKRIKELSERGLLGRVIYAEGEYMHRFTPGSWNRLTLADRDHWRNNMSAFFYCTHSLGPLIHIAGKRPVKVTGFEGPYTDRLYRLGMRGGSYAVEMVTLEDGTVLKSLHGCGATRKSYYYSFYGEKGRLETARADADQGYIRTLYYNCGPEIGTKDPVPEEMDTKDRLSEKAWTYGHYGADYYMMHNFVQALRGDKNADVIGIYEALDMALPGAFAQRSALAGGVPMDVPNLRDPAEREKWRNDTACCDPKAAGDQLLPSRVGGNPEIPQEIYDELKKVPWDKGNPWT